MSSENGPIDTDSASDAEQRYYLALDGVEIEFNTVKCPSEKKVTPHQWLMVHVGDNWGVESPIDLAEKHKRLTLCQSCGTLRLIK